MTTATGDPQPLAGAVDAPGESEQAARRRERVAGVLQRSGAFVVLVVVAMLASLVFGTRFASVDNFLNILEAS